MPSVDHYIAKAEECERRALTTTSPAIKELLLTSAREWRTIAAIPGLQLAASATPEAPTQEEAESDQQKMSQGDSI